MAILFAAVAMVVAGSTFAYCSRHVDPFNPVFRRRVIRAFVWVIVACLAALLAMAYFE